MADDIVLSLHRYLEARLRRSGQVSRVGPFTVTFDPISDAPFRNYAIPDVGAEPSDADIETLVRAFTARRREPRLELFPACAPAVEGALLRHDFAVELRPPVMAVDPAACPPPPAAPAGVTLRTVDPRDSADVAGAAVVAHLAFGEEGMPEQVDLDRLAGVIRRGGAVALARAHEDEPVGSAQLLDPIDGVSEIVGVAVSEPFRRRGIATSLLSLLLEQAAARGVSLAWLTPGDAGAERVYVGAGFRVVAQALHVRRP